MKIKHTLILAAAIMLGLSGVAGAQSFRVGSGAQLTCRASAPIRTSTNGVLWCNSTDSNALYYTTPASVSAAVGGGGGGTLAADYAAGASQTDSTLLLDSTRLGLLVTDNAAPISGSLLKITNSASTISYLDVSVTGIGFTGTLALGTAKSVRLFAQNTTAAADGAQQYSPVFALIGKGWGTTAGTSQTVNMGLMTRPVQGLVPTGDLVLMSGIAGGAYTESMAFQASGAITSPTLMQLKSSAADGATAVAASTDTTATWSNAAARLLSIRNNAVEKISVRANGNMIMEVGGGQGIYAPAGVNGILFYDSVLLMAGAGMRPAAPGIYLGSPSTNIWGEVGTTLVSTAPGADLTVSANAITPTAMIHRVGAGLIKTINLPGSGSFSGTVTVIPTAAYTMDGTGNIDVTGSASLAVVGKPMDFTYHTTAAKWFPSY
jgi:hypothetical protein